MASSYKECVVGAPDPQHGKCTDCRWEEAQSWNDSVLRAPDMQGIVFRKSTIPSDMRMSCEEFSLLCRHEDCSSSQTIANKRSCSPIIFPQICKRENRNLSCTILINVSCSPITYSPLSYSQLSTRRNSVDVKTVAHLTEFQLRCYAARSHPHNFVIAKTVARLIQL